MKNLTVLTNDPSITAWGWAVIHAGTNHVLEVGCIKTNPNSAKKRIRKSDDRTRRVSEINHQLLSLIHQYNIRYLLSEAPHGSQSAVAAVMIGMVAGMMQTISDVLNISIDWYSEGDVKKFMLGKRAASKGEMIEAVRQQMKVPFTGVKYHDEAVADAIAVYLTACNQSEIFKMVRRLND